MPSIHQPNFSCVTFQFFYTACSHNKELHYPQCMVHDFYNNFLSQARVISAVSCSVLTVMSLPFFLTSRWSFLKNIITKMEINRKQLSDQWGNITTATMENTVQLSTDTQVLYLGSRWLYIVYNCLREFCCMVVQSLI